MGQGERKRKMQNGHTVLKARELTARQAKNLFEREVRAAMHMSGAEFIRKYETGYFQKSTRTEVAQLATLIPLARQ